MFKEGQGVTILRDILQPEYIDTDAEILFKNTSEFRYYLRRWDGTECYYHGTSIISTADRYKTKSEQCPLTPPPIPGGCGHTKKYINKAMLKQFWVCPDCKKDLGDA